MLISPATSAACRAVSIRSQSEPPPDSSENDDFKLTTMSFTPGSSAASEPATLVAMRRVPLWRPWGCSEPGGKKRSAIA